MPSLKPSRIVAVYALVSALWILLSDKAAQLLFSYSVGVLTLVSTFKGWLYVAAVSAILLALLKKYEAQNIRQQAAITQSEERLNLALYAVSDGLWDWRIDTGEVFFNSTWYTMLGYEPDEFPQKYETWATLVHPEDVARVEQVIQLHLENKEPFSLEFRMRAKDGGWKWIYDRGQVIQQDASGNAVRMIGTHIDITERKRAEELRLQIEHTVNHNLRTPASNAINIARMLREEADLTAEQRKDLLDLFEQSGRNMLDTLNSSLDLYKIETGQYQLRPEVSDCLAILLELVESLAKEAQFSRLHAEVLLDGRPIGPDSRCLCLGVPSLVRTAIQNLLANAFEASPPDATVHVGLSLDKECRIEIRNQGVVPVEIRDRFFDKYVTKGKLKGTGLGTYSALMMVKAQNGDIAMRTSDRDNETVVTVRLPLPV